MADSPVMSSVSSGSIDAIMDGSVGADSDEADPPEPPAAHENLYLVDATASFGAEDMSWLFARATDVITLLISEGHRIARLSLRLVDDQEMADAHVRFSGVEGTTDVLCFHSDDEGVLEMDILACVDEAGRQAMDHGHALRNEILLYAVHGALHACGFDDADPEDFKSMHAEEDRILKAIGVGPVFRKENGE